MRLFKFFLPALLAAALLAPPASAQAQRNNADGIAKENRVRRSIGGDRFERPEYRLQNRDENHFEPRRNKPDTLPLHVQDPEALREELMDMTPEQRHEAIENLRQQHKTITKEQREKRRMRFEERWNNAGENERRQVCDNVRQHCADNADSHACEVALNACNSY